MEEKRLPRLVLASSSPRRKALLRQVGFSFRVVPSSVEETIRPDESPARNARRIALEKSREVARRLKRGLVVAADTLVVIDGRMLGKPRTSSEAIRMLRMLSGREHTVVTAFALVEASTGRGTTGVERTRVRFRKLSRAEIMAYVRGGSPFDKAGAYGIQDDFGAVFVEKVNGCFYNVVGFPLASFYVALKKFIRPTNRRVRD